MQSRFLAGWRGLSVAAAVAGLILLPAGDALAAKVKTQAGLNSTGSLTAVKEEPQIAQPLLFERSTYVWPFGTGPVYGEVEASRWSAPGVLHTAVGSFDLTRGIPDFPAELRAKVGVGPAQYFVLQVDPATFADGRFDSIRDLVTGSGGTIVEEMAVGGFIVRMNPAQHTMLGSQAGVLAVEPYHPAFKLSPTIGRMPLPDPTAAVSEVYSLEVMLFPGEDASAVAQAISSLGGSVTAIWDDLVKFDLHRSKLPQVAAIEAVKGVFESVPMFPKGEETTTVLQTGGYFGGAIPYHDAGIRGDGGGIAGAGNQILMVLDTGLQLDNGDLSNTRTNAGTASTAHRKVFLYTTTNAFGGAGDSLGCDAPASGGSTHGHVVSAAALGNGTAVPSGYGSGWSATDTGGNTWKLDGVAPRAKVLMYDAATTPSSLSCEDPTRNGLSVGNVYNDGSPGSGSLGDAYTNHGARVFNFSWGSNTDSTYASTSQKIDAFLFENLEGMVFISAGNEGNDSDADGHPNQSIHAPATAKSAIVVGATGNVDEPAHGFDEENIVLFSSVGPATVASNRVAPLLMAPGSDNGSMGMDSEYSCRSNDNDQANPVECDIAEGLSGTSFASPAAAGAALLVRDYFAQGFFPDGTSSNPGNATDQETTISGALVKSVLITSADFVGDTSLTIKWKKYRFSNHQGYGRIQLNNALPLNSYSATPSTLVVADGGVAGGPNNISGLSGTASAAGTTETATLKVNSRQQELRCSLAWIEDLGDTLAHDLDLELVSPTGKVFFGNFFTEDLDDDGVLDTVAPNIENCTSESPALLTESPWSIATNSCGASSINRRDTQNPTEAVMLSPDPDGNGIVDDPDTVGIDEGSDNQIELGDYSLKVIYRTGAGTQRYAASCSGPIALGSSVRLDQGQYVCNDLATITVTEVDEPSDLGTGLTVGEISSRTTIQVIDVGPNGIFDNGGGDDVVRDTETGITFTKPDAAALRFVSSDLALTDGTAYDPGNGALDVRSGNYVKVTYADETSGTPDANKRRFNSGIVDCSTAIGFGGVVWGQYGMDTSTLINGGCERDARGLFTFGFPDKYMDAGEEINYRIAFLSNEDGVDLQNVDLSLKCVLVDADSPADCKPGTTACADPNRLNNSLCGAGLMSILDASKNIGDLPAGAAVSANFNIRMAASISGTPKVEMVVGISAHSSGKPVESYVVSRHVLDVDETTLFYSTDFPLGGTEIRDWNNDETEDNPNTVFPDPQLVDDYTFDTRTYSNLTATNPGFTGPWNFDADNEGFRVGLSTASTDIGAQIIANLGEDKNFNGALDPGEDRDPSNGVLDDNWSTRGGCGWQTRSGATGGIWHTGRIDLTSLACGSQCETTDVLAGFGQGLLQVELLRTPLINKVNQGLDPEGDPLYRVEFTNFAWNMAIDLKTTLDYFSWELDTDTSKLIGSDLYDGTVFNLLAGAQGVISGGNAPLTDGFQTFAPFSGTSSVNGTVGNNRVGKNPCLFEQDTGRETALHFAAPADDDTNNDADASVDEYVTANGPIRNMDISEANGIDMRYFTMEDIYGESGSSFQGALGYWVFQGPSTSTQPVSGYGVGIDDVVVEWREFTQGKDVTAACDVAGGKSCATISLATTNFYEGSALLKVTILDNFPYSTANPNKNDCNLDGDYLDATDDNDCDNNGTVDIVAKAKSQDEPNGEVVVLNRVGTTPEYRGELSISLAYDTPGVLFMRKLGVFNVFAEVEYNDLDDGSGSKCQNDPDPARQGFVSTSTAIFAPTARVVVKGVRTQEIAGNGDLDSIPDTNETHNMFVTLTNKSGRDLSGIVLKLATNDTKIDCITQPVLSFGALADKETRESTAAFQFRVANVNRVNVNDDFAAAFSMTISGDDFDVSTRAADILVDLDLNITGGATPGSFGESFEVVSGFGSFTSMNLDNGKASMALSNGYRCQYNDPDGPNSQSPGRTQCFLGSPIPGGNLFDWHVHQSGATSPDGGRAYVGTRSLHWGRHPVAGNAGEDTTSLAQLDAVRLSSPVNLGYTGADPELSFKHQIGLTSFPFVNANPGTAADRGVVHIQLVDAAGIGIGAWKKVYPYENLYDLQGSDNFVNCIFDPIDDGNDEDDYFVPSDPNRRWGPSSTCAPEFVFARVGDIYAQNPFSSESVGNASDPPGLKGSLGPGTWVQSKFNLDRFRGRRIFLRFLTTSIEVEGVPTVDQALGGWNPTPGDDGWYIDDVQISNTLGTPATIALDSNANSGLPGCGTDCGTVTAVLTATPSSTPAPGHVSELSASDSSSDRCLNGTLQYQWWLDTNNNGVVGDAGDTLLRNWTDNAAYVDAPDETTRYGVKVRCSAAPSTCVDDAVVTVTVACPTSGNAVAFPESVGFSNKTTIAWTSVLTIDAIRGNLDTLRSSAGNFNGTVEACIANNVTASSVTDATTPAVGSGKYWLVREVGSFCNSNGSWSTGTPKEAPGRDTEIPLDPDTCP